MNSETWERIKELYALCQEVALQDREQFIQQASKGDPTVQREVFALLAAGDDSHFLDYPVAQIRRAMDPAKVHPFATVGEIISDRFRIEALIGQGGMGEVYRAADLELNRAVAIKTVRPGTVSC